MSSPKREWKVGDLCVVCLHDGEHSPLQIITHINSTGRVSTISTAWSGDFTTCGYMTDELRFPTASEIAEAADASRENFAVGKRWFGETIKGLAQAYTEAVKREEEQRVQA